MVHQVIFLLISSEYHFHKNDFKKFLPGTRKPGMLQSIGRKELNMTW